MINYYNMEQGFTLQHVYTDSCWVHLDVPQVEELEYIKHTFSIPSALLVDISDQDERPRVDSEGEWTLVVCRIPRKRDGEKLHFATTPLFMLFNNRVVVSLCHYQTEALQDFIVHMRHKAIGRMPSADFLLRLLMNGAVWYMNYTKRINNEVDRAEQQMGNTIRNQDLRGLMHWDKSLVFFEAALRGNQILLDKLQSYLHIPIDSGLYADVRTELHQAYEMVMIYHETLTSTMNTFSSVVANNVNLIMKRMTAVSLILMLPTLVASFYGMNLINHSELSPYAFYVVMGVSVLLAAFTCLLLKRKDWF